MAADSEHHKEPGQALEEGRDVEFVAADGFKAGDAPPRERFAETAYWNPLVVTGKDGKARVTFKAPNGPVGLSHHGPRSHGRRHAGRSDDFVVDGPQELLRRSQAARARSRRETSRGSSRACTMPNVTGKLALRLNIYAGGRDEVFPTTIDLKQDGVDEVLFEPFEVPETDSVRLTLTGAVGAVSDELVAEVPVRPWGVQVVASESGTGTDSNTIFVGLPAGRTYDNPEMLIVLSPTLSAC